MTNAGDPSQAKDKEKEQVIRTLVRGTLPTTKLVQFLALAKTLCARSEQHVEFREYDRVYHPAPEAKALKNSIRLRTRLQQVRAPQPANVNPSGQGPAGAAAAAAASRVTMASTATIIYSGPPDRRVLPPCEKRTVTSVVAGKEADALLLALGCKPSFEYVRLGGRLRTRAGLTIDVFFVERLTEPGDPTSSVSVTPKEDQHCVVEVWSDNGPSPEQLMTFMQQLSPFITLPTPPQARMR